uniref:Uncharacterized protein n=1 Tax=Rhizochromulina marina TaxID=1034831 RepID=A0A7S2WTM6_9STRA|mmetsp:Transcript_4743/g.14046  ORF Transcript_4743/g.14046 Transcript_4743/m.14046 type:complete len:387 (+) Transcript_4743:165-1325(+)
MEPETGFPRPLSAASLPAPAGEPKVPGPGGLGQVAQSQPPLQPPALHSAPAVEKTRENPESGDQKPSVSRKRSPAIPEIEGLPAKKKPRKKRKPRAHGPNSTGSSTTKRVSTSVYHQSGALLNGLDTRCIQVLCDVILAQVHRPGASWNIDWARVSSDLASKGVRWNQARCKVVWRFIAYGKLCRTRALEESPPRDQTSSPPPPLPPRKNSSTADPYCLVPRAQDDAESDSDEDEFACSPQDLDREKVLHRVRIVPPPPGGVEGWCSDKSSSHKPVKSLGAHDIPAPRDPVHSEARKTQLSKPRKPAAPGKARGVSAYPANTSSKAVPALGHPHPRPDQVPVPQFLSDHAGPRRSLLAGTPFGVCHFPAVTFTASLAWVNALPTTT